MLKFWSEWDKKFQVLTLFLQLEDKKRNFHCAFVCDFSDIISLQEKFKDAVLELIDMAFKDSLVLKKPETQISKGARFKWNF